jgi:hypothetical protein
MSDYVLLVYNNRERKFAVPVYVTDVKNAFNLSTVRIEDNQKNEVEVKNLKEGETYYVKENPRILSGKKIWYHVILTA